MRSDISQKIKEYAIKNPAIESIFCVKRFNDDEFYKIYTVVNDIIIGKLEEELKSLFDDVIFVRRVKESKKIEKKDISYTTIDLYKMDNTKVSETIISNEIAKDFINTLPADIEFLYNMQASQSLRANDDFTYEPIKDYEFEKTVKSFFAYAIEVSLYIKQNNYLAASIKMDDLRKELIKILGLHIIIKYRGKRDMGHDGRDLVHSLSIDYKQAFEESFHDIDPLNIYNSLFKSCVLFRKLGMECADELGFSYDKETDVKTMRLLRNNYKKLESFLN